MKKKTVTKVRKDKKRKVLEGIAHVSCTFNNTLVTITDRQGNKLTGSSAGACKFSGARKSTPTVAKIVAAAAAKQAKELYGLETVQINIWGPGPGREMAARDESEERESEREVVRDERYCSARLKKLCWVEDNSR